MIIHIVTSDFTLKAKSKRYVVSLNERDYEFPAMKTDCIILNPYGSLTSGAVKLAEEYRTTIIFVDDDLKIMYLSFLDVDKDVKYLLGQVESFLHRRDEYARMFLRAAENARKQLVKYLGLNFVGEGKFWRDEEKYIQCLEEVFGQEVRYMVNFARIRLIAECLHFLLKAGLNPSLGFLHEGEASLARDLALEFQYNVSDLAAVHVIKRGGDVKNLIQTYQKRMEAGFTHPVLKRPITYREAIRIQAKTLAATMISLNIRYSPLKVRIQSS